MRHPLHPMLAHFPVACWSLATLADFASLHFGRSAWQLSGTLMGIGVVMALPTVVLGVFELIQVPDEPGPMRNTYAHMGLMLAALGLYVASWMMRIHDGHLQAPDGAALAVSAVGFVVLLVGGWLGGTLVYGYGVGSGQADSRDA